MQGPLLKTGHSGILESPRIITKPSNGFTKKPFFKKGYKDEFVLDLGWTEFGIATTGNWERAIPDNIYTWQGSMLPDEGDLIGDIGDYCLVTGNNGAGVHGADDIDGGATTIMSPPMDLSSAIDPLLSFHFVFSKPWPPNAEDSFEVYMTNGSDTVTLMSTLMPEYDWSGKQEIRILDFIALSNNMRVYFKANDDSPGDVVEALVDLFLISDSMATSIATIANKTVDLQYYPNPFDHSIQINYSIENSQQQATPVQVFNTLGQLIEERVLVQATGRLELGQSWDRGVYFITIGNRTIKVVKSK